MQTESELNDWTGGIIGAAIEVHRILGPGFVEAVYERALAVELELRNIPFRRQVPISLGYKGQVIGEHRIDLLVVERVIVELKAVDALSTLHSVQLRSYLRATGLTLGLLINFNVPVLHLGIKRMIESKPPLTSAPAL